MCEAIRGPRVVALVKVGGHDGHAGTPSVLTRPWQWSMSFLALTKKCLTGTIYATHRDVNLA